MTATKYTFDVEFRDEGDLVSNDARARQKKAYTHSEIDQLCNRARTEGMKAGQVRAQEAIAAATEQTATTLRALLDAIHTDIEALRAEAAILAFAAARKLAHAALAAVPQSEIESALREAMHQALGEPRVLLRTSLAIAEAITPRLSEIAHEEGYDGRVQISADATLKGTDCRIEWRGGGAERSEAAIETALDDLIARHFSESAREPLTEK